MSVADGEQLAVTWLLPVKNGMPYLTHALRSIAEQTYARQQVLAWDNGSTDGSAEELRKWVPRIVPGTVVTDRPMPLGASLRTMVEMTATPWCARLDADDVAEPNRLREQVAAVSAAPSTDLVGSGMTLIDASGRETGVVTPPYRCDQEVRWALRFGNVINHPTVLLRRDAVLAAGNYRDLTPGQDYDLWVRMAVRHRMINLDRPLTRYRLHDTSVTRTHGDDPSATSRRIRHAHLDTLWPQVDAEQATRLMMLLDQRGSLDVSFGDVLALRRSAIAAARRSGLHAGYFQEGARFREQQRSLVTRWVKRRLQPLGVWDAARRLLARPPHPIGSAN